jgi:hypothetical protein
MEMEGGKPGWNDAMNGLPGLLGSGMPETFEILRIIRYSKLALSKHNRGVDFPSEFATFIASLVTAIDTYNGSPKSGSDDLKYWDASATARETYRAATVAYFEGSRQSLSTDYLQSVLSKMEAKMESGIARALATDESGTGLAPTYFYYDCTDFALSQDNRVTPNGFNLRTLPLFLEGPMRHMKIVKTIEEKRNIYQAVKKSPLYDVALKMFMICESLATMGQEVGRMKAFNPGWLENQSVWLHMSYKFYLEVLRAGLFEEFFTEIKTGLVPFMDSNVYGRSPLEAASFIVSSAFPDKSLHGASFLARLSGSTAEFQSMWQLMMSGPAPFSVDDKGHLQLTFRPALPGSWFDENDEISFTFLGEIEVTYKNSERKDTWTVEATSAEILKKDGSGLNVDGEVLNSDIAQLVRSLQVSKILINF